MKKIIQKFFSLVISMALVTSLISVTAMADVTEPITPYAADFQTRTSGETYTIHNKFPNLGRSADMWYADSAGVKGSSDVAVSGGDYDPIRFFDRGDGNIALRMGTSKISLPSGDIYAEAFVIESWTSQRSVSPKLFKYKLS